MGTWDDLEKRLEIFTQDEEVKKPTAADLDRFEKEFQFKLPKSYREFALTFGPGDLGTREWKIMTPGFPKAEWADLSSGVRNWRENGFGSMADEQLAKIYPQNPALLRRLVAFGDCSLTELTYAWDLEDVTEHENHEYAIYILRSDHAENPVQRVASTFREFIMDYALGGGYERHMFKGDAVNKSSDWDKPDPIEFGQASLKPDEN